MLADERGQTNASGFLRGTSACDPPDGEQQPAQRKRGRFLRLPLTVAARARALEFSYHPVTNTLGESLDAMRAIPLADPPPIRGRGSRAPRP